MVCYSQATCPAKREMLSPTQNLPNVRQPKFAESLNIPSKRLGAKMDIQYQILMEYYLDLYSPIFLKLGEQLS